jgi:transcription elongation factor GreA
MSIRSPQPFTARSWPLTSAAHSELIAEIHRTRETLVASAEQAWDDDVFRLPAALTARRLDTLEDILARTKVVDGNDHVVIGRRVTLRDDAGRTSYEIVVPGEGDPDNGRISADSPLGGAILGARAGEVVEVAAPAGPWRVTVVAVE